jgi:hypothetical protein
MKKVEVELHNTPFFEFVSHKVFLPVFIGYLMFIVISGRNIFSENNEKTLPI